MAMLIRPQQYEEEPARIPQSQPVKKLKTKQKGLAKTIGNSESHLVPAVLPAQQKKTAEIHQLPTDEERRDALVQYNERMKNDVVMYHRWLQAFASFPEEGVPYRVEKTVVPILGTDKSKTHRREINKVYACWLIEGDSWGNHDNTSLKYTSRGHLSREKRGGKAGPNTLVTPIKTDKWDGKHWEARTPTEGFEWMQRPPTLNQLLAHTWRSQSLTESDEEVNAIVDKMIGDGIAQKVGKNLELYGTPLCKLELDLETGQEVIRNAAGYPVTSTKDYLTVMRYRAANEEMLAPPAEEELVGPKLPKYHLLGPPAIPQPELLLLPSPAYFIQQDLLLAQQNSEKVTSRNVRYDYSSKVTDEWNSLLRLRTNAAQRLDLEAVGARDHWKYHCWLRDNTQDQYEVRPENYDPEVEAYAHWLSDRTATQSLSLEVTRQLAQTYEDRKVQLRLSNRRALQMLDMKHHAVPSHSKAGGVVYRSFERQNIRDDDLRWRQWWCAVLITSGQGDLFKQMELEHTGKASVIKGALPGQIPTESASTEPAPVAVESKEVTVIEKPKKEPYRCKAIPSEKKIDNWIAEMVDEIADRLEREDPILVLDDKKISEAIGPVLPDPQVGDGKIDEPPPPVTKPEVKVNLVDLIERKKAQEAQHFSDAVPLGVTPVDFDPIAGLFVPKGTVIHKQISMEEMIDKTEWKVGPRGLVVPKDTSLTFFQWLDKPLFSSK